MPVDNPVVGVRLKASIRDYILIARPDHWVKHIFIVPGILAAIVLVPPISFGVVWINLILGFSSACLIASANYVINEWLDASFDRHHPAKMNRPAAMGRLSAAVVYSEYIVLAAIGIVLATFVGRLFFVASAALLISGIIYNVSPMRTKDRAYLDVLSEAMNNPIRLVLGWAMVSGITVPPSSLVGAFWMGGAFLMTAKRLSEFRFIVERNGKDGPGLYRRSFRFYTSESLIISCFFYAILAAFLIAVFLIKYRSEYVLTFPLIALLFAYYLYLGLQPMSVAQRPEKLHTDRRLVGIMIALIVLMIVLSFVNLPVLDRLVQSTFMMIHVK